MNLHPVESLQFVDTFWEEKIFPTLSEYITIPNQSPLFDQDWERAGYMDSAVELVRTWCDKHAPDGTKLNVHKSTGRTPLLLIDIPGQ